MHLGLNGRINGEEAGGCKSTKDNACDWLFIIFYPKLVLRNDRILTTQTNKELSKGKVKHDQRHPWLTTISRFHWMQISTQQRMTREWQYFCYTSNTYGCVREGVRGDTHTPPGYSTFAVQENACYRHFMAF